MTVALTEDRVWSAINNSTGGVSTQQIRVALGAAQGKTTSNRLAYLLRKMAEAGRVSSMGYPRARRWFANQPEAVSLPSALILVSDDYDPPVLVKATPETAEGAQKLREMSTISEDIARGENTKIDHMSTACRIKAGVINVSEVEPELVPAGAREMLIWMEGIDFEVLSSHVLGLTPEYDLLFSVRCHPD